MEKESPTSGLEPDKLQHLLRICSEVEPAKEQVDSDHRKSGLLEDMLAETLPVKAFTSNLSKHLKTLCKIFGISSDETIGDLLRNPKTDVNLLKIIRDYFKKKSKCVSPEVEQVATTIYYAAIAYALVVHGSKITKFSYYDLYNAFSVLANTKWIPQFLSHLFGKACEYCQNKSTI